jgi:hypothetical protein
MAEGAFTFIQAVFHVVLFIVVHGHRTRRDVKTQRKQRGLQKRNSSVPPAYASEQSAL